MGSKQPQIKSENEKEPQNKDNYKSRQFTSFWIPLQPKEKTIPLCLLLSLKRNSDGFQTLQLAIIFLLWFRVSDFLCTYHCLYLCLLHIVKQETKIGCLINFTIIGFNWNQMEMFKTIYLLLMLQYELTCNLRYNMKSCIQF